MISPTPIFLDITNLIPFIVFFLSFFKLSINLLRFIFFLIFKSEKFVGSLYCFNKFLFLSNVFTLNH